MFSNLDRVVTQSLLNGFDKQYFKNYFDSFRSGMFKSANTAGFFKSNDKYEQAHGEGGLAPYNATKYANKFGGNLGIFGRNYAKITNAFGKLGGSRLVKVNEGVDNIAYTGSSQNAAYKYLMEKYSKEFPDLNKEDIKGKVMKALFPISMSDAMLKAEEQLRTANIKKNITDAEIKRVAIGIIEDARSEDVRHIASQKGLEASYRNKPRFIANEGGGFVETIAYARESALSSLKVRIDNNKNSSKSTKAFLKGSQAIVKLLTIPFLRTPANMIEVGSHYALWGGVIKLASLAKYKRDLNKNAADNQAELYLAKEAQKEVSIRMVKGLVGLAALSGILAALQGDDDEEKWAVCGNSYDNGKNRNSFVMNGKAIPLAAFGVLSVPLALLGAKHDVDKFIKLKDVNEEEFRAGEKAMFAFQDAFVNYSMTVINSSPFVGTSKVMRDFIRSKGKSLFRTAANMASLAILPAPRQVNDFSNLFYTKQLTPVTSSEFAIKGTYSFILPMVENRYDIDKFGNPIDPRERAFMSVTGMIYRLGRTDDNAVNKEIEKSSIKVKEVDLTKILKKNSDGKYEQLGEDEAFKASQDIASKVNEVLSWNKSTPYEFSYTKKDGKVENVELRGLLQYKQRIASKYDNAMSNPKLNESDKLLFSNPTRLELQKKRELSKYVNEAMTQVINKYVYDNGLVFSKDVDNKFATDKEKEILEEEESKQKTMDYIIKKNR
jgi:hypothetical protein